VPSTPLLKRGKEILGKKKILLRFHTGSKGKEKRRRRRLRRTRKLLVSWELVKERGGASGRRGGEGGEDQPDGTDFLISQEGEKKKKPYSAYDKREGEITPQLALHHHREEG